MPKNTRVRNYTRENILMLQPDYMEVKNSAISDEFEVIDDFVMSSSNS